MRIFYTISLFSFLLLATPILHAQGAEKTLVKSFNIEGNQVVELQLDGNVEVQEWNNSIMRIQMSITLPNGSNAMLKSLIQAGRYNLKGKSATQDYQVSAPNLQKKITVGGQQLNEQLTFLVYAPADVIVKLSNSTTANALNSAESF